MGVTAAVMVPLFGWAVTSPALLLWDNRLFDAFFAIMAVFFLVGLYAVASPFVGLPMPPVRDEPLWRHPAPPLAAAPATGPPREEQAPPVQLPPERREIVEVPPSYLVGFFKGRTGLEAESLAQPYIGKWMRVSGPLANASQSFGGPVGVTFAVPPGTYTDVYMYFRESWIDRLRVIQPGTEITVLGRIDQVLSDAIHLGDCELEEAGG